MEKILVATDGSETAGRAVDRAAELAKATGAKLYILTVESERIFPLEKINELVQAKGDVPIMMDTPAMLDEFCKQAATNAEVRARVLGAPAIESEVRWGDAAETILETARSEGVDTIVLGRRGHGRLAGLLVGSVSHKVVSLSPCTVIVVP